MTARTMIQAYNGPPKFAAQRVFEIVTLAPLGKQQTATSDSWRAIKCIVDFGLMQIIDDKVRRISGRD
jgi:hypothetical protein